VCSALGTLIRYRRYRIASQFFDPLHMAQLRGTCNFTKTDEQFTTLTKLNLCHIHTSAESKLDDCYLESSGATTLPAACGRDGVNTWMNFTARGIPNTGTLKSNYLTNITRRYHLHLAKQYTIALFRSNIAWRQTLIIWPSLCFCGLDIRGPLNKLNHGCARCFRANSQTTCSRSSALVVQG